MESRSLFSMCFGVFLSFMQLSSLRWNQISTPKFLLCSVVMFAGDYFDLIHVDE